MATQRKSHGSAHQDGPCSCGSNNRRGGTLAERYKNFPVGKRYLSPADATGRYEQEQEERELSS